MCYALSVDIVRDIRDPEKPETLEELDVVYESGVTVALLKDNTKVIEVEFTPTVPHCNLATLIGMLSSCSFPLLFSGISQLSVMTVSSLLLFKIKLL